MYGYIYKVKNLRNNKVYIGQTVRTVEQRWQEHIQKAFSDKKQDIHYFQQAIRKYGPANFKVSIIATAENREELDDKEKYYIQFFNSTDSRYGYNLTPGGQGGKTTSVYQLDLSGKIIQHFSSISQASRESGCMTSAIIACCCKIYNQSCGYQWCYTEYIQERINKPVKPQKHTNIPVIQLDKQDNVLYIWNSIQEAEQTLGIPHSKICLVCKGKRKTTGGFKWKYLYPTAENFTSKQHLAKRAVIQYSKRGEFLKRYDTVTEAALAIGQQKGGHVSDVCKRKRPYYGGFIWRYEGDTI